MATAVDIVVKKADNTTDITYSLVTASGGDTSPAVWRSNTASGTLGQRPVFQISSRWNGPKTVRRVDINGSFPSVYTDANTGLTQVRGTIPFSASFAVPQNISATDLGEAAAQLCNLVASTMTRSSVTSGYAPT
jgi:hypothetical protein